MKNLAIVTTHPIQYYAPVFTLLSARQNLRVKVFYTVGKQYSAQYDRGFGKEIVWDTPLLDGYEYEWVENKSKTPGSHHFLGISNPYLISRLKDWTPDAILFFGWSYLSHLRAMSYFKDRVPVYFRGDSTLLNRRASPMERLKCFFLKWVYRQVDHAFYVGTNNKAYFKKYGLQDKQLSFAPHAVDNTRFEDKKTSEAAGLRSGLGIGLEDIVILFAGKFDHVKNVDLLLTAFSRLNKRGVHLLLVGNGLMENTLKEQARLSGCPDQIHFLDFKNQSYMPVIYQAADLVCLPSRSETWGLAINEAMACSKAVLVSDKVGCAADLIAENKNGAIFKSEDAGQLLTCLEKLTISKKQLLSQGKVSGAIIKEWNFTKIAEAIENKLTNEAI